LPDGRPDFSLKVEPNGYAWWYVDAISHDGVHGLTIIGFVGSVFSPYYKHARRRGFVDPENFCSINVALYSRGAARWTMTERAKSQLTRSRDHFSVGPSSMNFGDRGLTIDIDEKAFPLISPVRGTIRLIPTCLPATLFYLDADGKHVWQPLAPAARIEVEMREPSLSWSGMAYFDHNCGQEPIEDGFSEWDWSRSDAGQSWIVLYDTLPRQGAPRHLALRFNGDGSIEDFEPPPRHKLSTSLWRMKRQTRSEGEKTARVVRTFEDAPFYSRSMIESRLFGQNLLGVHESLSLNRFCNPVVQAMLPFRMPRVGASRAFF
jgi:carotenoid 1,2-hydratase